MSTSTNYSPSFVSAEHEAIHMLAQHYATPYEGDTESAWGAFARISIGTADLAADLPASVRKILRDNKIRKSALLGHHLLVEDSLGFKWLSTFETDATADAAFDAHLASYNAWHSADDAELEEVMAY